jgi:hypothetical protein
LTTFGVTFVATTLLRLDALERAFEQAFEGLISELEDRLLITVYGEGTCGHEVAKSLALDLESALDVGIVWVDQDLVDIPEIARRTSRTRQNIQQLVTGLRGSNDFPTPLGAPGGKRIWDWSSVNEWFRVNHVTVDDEVWLSRADVAIVNAWLVERKSISLIETRTAGTVLDAHTAIWLVYTFPSRPSTKSKIRTPSVARGVIAATHVGNVAR